MKITELKKIEKAYQISKDWYEREAISEKEYLEKIGDWKDLEPCEIVEVMCEHIQDL